MKIAIYGGTFSPVHIGHVKAVETFLQKVECDRFLIIPTFIPPHKSVEYKVSCELRLEMCRESFLSLSPKIEVCDYEIQKGGKSYSFDTVAHFMKEGDVILLCGEDMLLSLESWYRAAELMKMCSFAVLPREIGNIDAMEKEAERLCEKYGAHITVIHREAYVLSSTDVREAVKNGDDYSSLVTDGVKKTIEENNLYR